MFRKHNQCPECRHIGRTIHQLVDDSEIRSHTECEQCHHTWVEVYDFSDIDAPSSLEDEIAWMHKAPEIVNMEDNAGFASESHPEAACMALAAKLEANYLHYRDQADQSSPDARNSVSPQLLRHIRAACATQVFRQAQHMAAGFRNSRTCAKLAQVFESRFAHYFHLAAHDPDEWGDVPLLVLRHLRILNWQRGFAEALRLAEHELAKFRDGALSHPTTCPNCDESPQSIHYWADESVAEFFVQCEHCGEMWVETYAYDGWRESTNLDKEIVQWAKISKPSLKHAPSERSIDKQRQRQRKSS